MGAKSSLTERGHGGRTQGPKGLRPVSPAYYFSSLCIMSLSSLVPQYHVLTSGVGSAMTWTNVLTLNTANCSTVNTSSITMRSLATSTISLESTVIALGSLAGSTLQNNFAVAIGANAGQSSQGTSSIAIGLEAGRVSQGANAVAMGTDAGSNLQ